jgi:hypothetical protein
VKRPDTYTAAITDPVRATPRGRPSARRLPGHRRPHQRQVQRTSITLELNADLPPLLRQIAEAYGISPAGLADVLLAHSLHAFCDDQIDLSPVLLPSRSPRYLWTVDVHTDDLHILVTDYLRRQTGNEGDQP